MIFIIITQTQVHGRWLVRYKLGNSRCFAGKRSFKFFKTSLKGSPIYITCTRLYVLSAKRETFNHIAFSTRTFYSITLTLNLTAIHTKYARTQVHRTEKSNILKKQKNNGANSIIKFRAKLADLVCPRLSVQESQKSKSGYGSVERFVEEGTNPTQESRT